eukprot:m.363827 g.363827  ORF g.363827 m.363827 type:complete len:286 (-) comp24286_c0_seq1:136-993(-)
MEHSASQVEILMETDFKGFDELSEVDTTKSVGADCDLPKYVGTHSEKILHSSSFYISLSLFFLSISLPALYDVFNDGFNVYRLGKTYGLVSLANFTIYAFNEVLLLGVFQQDESYARCHALVESGLSSLNHVMLTASAAELPERVKAAELICRGHAKQVKTLAQAYIAHLKKCFWLAFAKLALAVVVAGYVIVTYNIDVVDPELSVSMRVLFGLALLLTMLDVYRLVMLHRDTKRKNPRAIYNSSSLQTFPTYVTIIAMRSTLSHACDLDVEDWLLGECEPETTA